MAATNPARSSRATYRHEELQKVPRGYRVRSVKRGSHVVRIAFPPGRRKKGSGKVIEILHPKAENNPSCIVSNKAKNNPGELLIFGNPSNPKAFSGWSHFTKQEKNFLQSIHAPAPKNEEEVRAYKETLKKIDEINAKYRNPGKVRVFFDKGLGGSWVATVFHEKYGNLFASGKTKEDARAKLKERVTHAEASKSHRNPKRATPRRRRKDRINPDETKQAVKLFQSFHGKDPKDIVEKHVSAAVRKDYAALGDLSYLKVVTPLGQAAQFNFDDDGVKLASSPDGKQLYCIGGNQNLGQCLDKDSMEKDFIDLGEAVEVQYLARKIHGNFEPIKYFHKFGEVTGARPHLAYDKLKRQIFFIGGEYFIDAKQGVSPGIEN